MIESVRGYDAATTRASLASIRNRANLRRVAVAALLAPPIYAIWNPPPDSLRRVMVGCMDTVETVVLGIPYLVMLVVAVSRYVADRNALKAGGAEAHEHHRRRVDQALRATGWLRLSWRVALAVVILYWQRDEMAHGYFHFRPESPWLLFAAFLIGVVIHRRCFWRPRLLRERAALDNVIP